MNGLMQLCAAVAVLLWDRSRRVRGTWRRKEWRNCARHAFWFALISTVACSVPLLALALLWVLLR